MSSSPNEKESVGQRTCWAVLERATELSHCPIALLKYVIFGHPRFLMRGLRGAQTEISLATLAYNLKTMMSVLCAAKLEAALA